jgi:CheY-like chemotaxis protein
MSGNVPTEDASVCHEKATILVVDDEILTRMAASEELRERGYSVIEATSAHEALSVLHGPTRVDLVLTDMRMPGALDGGALARHIRAEFPFVKVVMVSGQVPGPDVRPALHGYLPKPVDPTQLASYLQTLAPVLLSPEAS